MEEISSIQYFQIYNEIIDSKLDDELYSEIYLETFSDKFLSSIPKLRNKDNLDLKHISPLKFVISSYAGAINLISLYTIEDIYLGNDKNDIASKLSRRKAITLNTLQTKISNEILTCISDIEKIYNNSIDEIDKQILDIKKTSRNIYVDNWKDDNFRIDEKSIGNYVINLNYFLNKDLYENCSFLSSLIIKYTTLLFTPIFTLIGKENINHINRDFFESVLKVIKYNRDSLIDFIVLYYKYCSLINLREKSKTKEIFVSVNTSEINRLHTFMLNIIDCDRYELAKSIQTANFNNIEIKSGKKQEFLFAIHLLSTQFGDDWRNCFLYNWNIANNSKISTKDLSRNTRASLVGKNNPKLYLNMIESSINKLKL